MQVTRGATGKSCSEAYSECIASTRTPLTRRAEDGTGGDLRLRCLSRRRVCEAARPGRPQRGKPGVAGPWKRGASVGKPVWVLSRRAARKCLARPCYSCIANYALIARTAAASAFLMPICKLPSFGVCPWRGIGGTAKKTSFHGSSTILRRLNFVSYDNPAIA